MRYIKKNDLRARIPAAWLQAAKVGLMELQNKTTHTERSQFIAKFFRDNAKLWSELKNCMAQPVPAKCWYSEVQRPMSDLEIDHFRPKNAVRGINHEGYWWLAFEWENFRISSSLANKRRKDNRTGTVEGKGTHFPLIDETKRITVDTSTEGEKPMLLDPFVATDVLLLDYEVESGKVVEKHSKTDNEEKHLRANKSIELYHLNEGTLIAQRAERGAVLKASAERIEKLLSRQESGQKLSQVEDNELERLQNEVAGYINATAEYSAFFRALLKQLGRRGWNEELLERT